MWFGVNPLHKCNFYFSYFVLSLLIQLQMPFRILKQFLFFFSNFLISCNDVNMYEIEIQEIMTHFTSNIK